MSNEETPEVPSKTTNNVEKTVTAVSETITVVSAIIIVRKVVLAGLKAARSYRG